MSDQLPAVLPSGAIAPASLTDTYILVPALVAASGHEAAERFLNFFATQIENDNTRAAYLRATREFLAWCDDATAATAAGHRRQHGVCSRASPGVCCHEAEP